MLINARHAVLSHFHNFETCMQLFHFCTHTACYFKGRYASCIYFAFLFSPDFIVGINDFSKSISMYNLFMPSIFMAAFKRTSAILLPQGRLVPFHIYVSSGTPERIFERGAGNEWQPLIGHRIGIHGQSPFKFLQLHFRLQEHSFSYYQSTS